MFSSWISYLTEPAAEYKLTHPMHKRVGSFEALVLWMKWNQLLGDERLCKRKENLIFCMSFSSGQEL